jgi:hypothetical protein
VEGVRGVVRLSGVEVGVGVDVGHSVVEGVGGDPISIDLSRASCSVGRGSMVSRGSMDNWGMVGRGSVDNWSMASHSSVGSAQELGGGGGHQGRAEDESLMA